MNHTPPGTDLETLDVLDRVAAIVDAMRTGEWFTTAETLDACAGMLHTRALIHRADRFAWRAS